MFNLVLFPNSFSLSAISNISDSLEISFLDLRIFDSDLQFVWQISFSIFIIYI